MKLRESRPPSFGGFYSPWPLDPLDPHTTVGSWNIPLEDFPLWSASSNYQVGARVLVLYDEAGVNPILPEGIYFAATANSGKYPPANPEHWIYIGPTNRTAAWDDSPSTATVFYPTYFEPGVYWVGTAGDHFDSVYVFRTLNATNVEVHIETEPGGQRMVVNEDVVSDSAGFSQATAVHFPTFSGTRFFGVYIRGVSGKQLSVGMVKIGGDARVSRMPDELVTLLGCSVGIEDFSYKSVNEFGQREVVERVYSDYVRARLILDNSIIDPLKQALTRYRAKPAIFDFNEHGTKHQSLMLFGYYKQFEVEITYYNESICSLEVESMS